MNRNPIITSAVTGSGDRADKHPDLPKSPAQIATAAIEAAKAGAAIAHLHVREPETGMPSRDVNLYREVVVGRASQLALWRCRWSRSPCYPAAT